jgi:hypothetical protein
MGPGVTVPVDKAVSEQDRIIEFENGRPDQRPFVQFDRVILKIRIRKALMHPGPFQICLIKRILAVGFSEIEYEGRFRIL